MSKHSHNYIYEFHTGTYVLYCSCWFTPYLTLAVPAATKPTIMEVEVEEDCNKTVTEIYTNILFNFDFRASKKHLIFQEIIVLSDLVI